MSLRLINAYHECLATYLCSKKKRRASLFDFDRALWKECAMGRPLYAVTNIVRTLNKNASTMSHCLTDSLRAAVMDWCRHADDCLAVVAFQFRLPKIYATEQTKYAEKLFSRPLAPVVSNNNINYMGDPDELIRLQQSSGGTGAGGAGHQKMRPRPCLGRGRWYCR